MPLIANEKVITQESATKGKLMQRTLKQKMELLGNFVADANASDEVALKSSLKCKRGQLVD